jgi:hypothetical protein
VTDPNIQRLKPRRPCVPITTRSWSAEASRIACTGARSSTRRGIARTPAVSAAAIARSSASSARFLRSCQSWAEYGSASGLAVPAVSGFSSAYRKVTSAPSARASASPSSIAFVAQALPSVGIRIRAYIQASLLSRRRFGGALRCVTPQYGMPTLACGSYVPPHVWENAGPYLPTSPA